MYPLSLSDSPTLLTPVCIPYPAHTDGVKHPLPTMHFSSPCSIGHRPIIRLLGIQSELGVLTSDTRDCQVQHRPQQQDMALGSTRGSVCQYLLFHCRVDIRGSMGMPSDCGQDEMRPSLQPHDNHPAQLHRFDAP